jgi:hypothetical protein
MPLRERLPNIPIPLRRADPVRMNYREAPTPNWDAADAARDDQLFREHGLR